MASIRTHRDLIVWQKAMALVEHVYRLTPKFPRSEQFGLLAQVRKSAISIPSNIAEGFNRRARSAYAYHLSVALGSQAELDTQLEIAFRVGYITADERAVALADVAEVGRLINGLRRKLVAPDTQRLTPDA